MAGQQPVPQRAWRAACPNCGAPVDFRSAASASAVCSFCRSTLVREGEALRRIGESAELFADHSPLQLGVTGRAQDVTFTLVGRLQFGYAGSAASQAIDGTWNEWHALFDNGRSAWLTEDNGAYVLAFEVPLPGVPPAPDELVAGRRVAVGGTAWDVASVMHARLLAAQGELPVAPRMSGSAIVADLRNALGEVATLDYRDPAAVQFSIGRAVELPSLGLEGLRGDSERALGGRALNCPHCGASLQPQLAATRSLSCGQCHAVVDISQGPVGELAHHEQAPRSPSGRRPKIALGATGRLAVQGTTTPTDWQIVGYVERADLPEETGEAATHWSEYLLFNRTQGFAFLVDAQDGWSLVRPVTGAPQVKAEEARWQGRRYRQTYAYTARVVWVEGEFYWRVQRDERARVTDYIGVGDARDLRLSREQTGNEVTWSAGQALEAAAVARAFGLSAAQQAALGADARPTAAASTGLNLKGWLILFVILAVIVIVMSRCGESRDCSAVARQFGADSGEYQRCLQARSTGTARSGGGSFGGYSSGGGHK